MAFWGPGPAGRGLRLRLELPLPTPRAGGALSPVSRHIAGPPGTGWGRGRGPAAIEKMRNEKGAGETDS